MSEKEKPKRKPQVDPERFIWNDGDIVVKQQAEEQSEEEKQQ